MFLPGCHSFTQAAETRFVAEYGCGDIRAVMLGGGAIRVTGCGRRATYVCQNYSSASPCIRESVEEVPDPPVQPSRLAVEGTTVDGAYAVRLRIEPGSTVLEYVPVRARDIVTVVPVRSSCDRFALRHSAGTFESVQLGMSLPDLARLRFTEGIELLVCDETFALSAAERAELERFVSHAMRMRQSLRS